MADQPSTDDVAKNIVSDIATVTSAAADIATATTWTAIIGFFTALPGMIALVRSFMSWINSISGNDPQKLISDLGVAFNQLSQAKTDEDKTNAAKSISDIIGRIPK